MRREQGIYTACTKGSEWCEGERRPILREFRDGTVDGRIIVVKGPINRRIILIRCNDFICGWSYNNE